MIYKDNDGIKIALEQRILCEKMTPEVDDRKAQIDAKALFDEFKIQIAGNTEVDELAVHGHVKNAKGNWANELDFKNTVVDHLNRNFNNISDHYNEPTAFKVKKAASFNDILNAINNGQYEKPKTQAEWTASYFMRNVRNYTQDLAEKEKPKPEVRLTSGGGVKKD